MDRSVMTEEQQEVLVEIEAVEAVYGSDCHVIQKFPPHFNVHMKPRTADDSSQQFVEVNLGIRADAQYPEQPPDVKILDSKGLDEKRQAHLISVILDKAQELASCPMLVALCEEAVETLSSMNQPDGDCPLCLSPLVTEVGHCDFLPFMKLMSCFHCFHSECIVRWWKWLQEQRETNTTNFVETTTYIDHENGRRTEVHDNVKQGLGNCPVCRKVFHTKDIEHVLDLIGSDSSQVSFEETSTNDNELEFLHSEMENNRRQKYEATLKIQEENRGLIEARRNDVLMPRMFLPESATVLVASINFTTDEQQDEGSAYNPPLELDLGSSSSKPNASKQNNSSMRKKNRGHHPRKHMNAPASRKQWMKKERITPD